MRRTLEIARGALEAVLDTMFPLRERAARTKARRAEDIPLSPTTHELLGSQITTLAAYHEDAVRDLVQSLKYDHSRYAGILAAGLIEEYLREEIASHRLFSQKPVLLVPVPLHFLRERDRGFNQMHRALAALPRDLRDGTLARVAPEALARARATKPQTLLSRVERLSNVAGAFTTDETLVKGTHIFLIDDVATTGATLVNASTPLRRAGAEVSCIALARA